MAQYFKSMVTKAGVPCQRLINFSLRDGLAQHRKRQTQWPSAG